jgi:hypothetical protein
MARGFFWYGRLTMMSQPSVFSVYEGSSAAAIRQLNERAGIPGQQDRGGDRDDG